MITTNGVFGIDGETVNPSSFYDSFYLVYRGPRAGEPLSFTFMHAGGASPAVSVSYPVAPVAHVNPWNDVAYPLAVKPIGFPRTCWHVVTDAGDTGIDLEVGP